MFVIDVDRRSPMNPAARAQHSARLRVCPGDRAALPWPAEPHTQAIPATRGAGSTEGAHQRVCGIARESKECGALDRVIWVRKPSSNDDQDDFVAAQIVGVMMRLPFEWSDSGTLPSSPDDAKPPSCQD